jgi:hypothetical protein
MPNLFGFSFGKNNKDLDSSLILPDGTLVNPSFVEPEVDDGSTVVSGGGHFGQYLDLDGAVRNDAEMIIKYRSMTNHAEIEMAMEDILNEAIVYELDYPAVKLRLDQSDLPENIKDKITEEFNNILRLLDFANKGYQIFRRWYIDGRLYFHIIVDPNNTKKGIRELRAVDAVKIKKIKKIDKVKDATTQIPIVTKVEDFYIYYDKSYMDRYGGGGMSVVNNQGIDGIKIAKEAICYVPSGMYDFENKRVTGYLQKAIKPLNQLRMIEDAVVIYRISRAPERRIFYIDVGSLPKTKAEQYLREIMNKYRNKLVYDASTGELKDDKKHMTMLEDFWLPRREGGRGTEISTLDGGQNLGEMDDVEYFKKKLYRALNVPVTRLEPDSGFNMGRSSEITRDELKFSKFIDKLRSAFSQLFINLLKTQVILKGVMREEEWRALEQDIRFDFIRDSYFTELKNAEMMKERLEILQQMEEFIGTYYSRDFVRKNVLRQTEEEIKDMEAQIRAEEKSGDIDINAKQDNQE